MWMKRIERKWRKRGKEKGQGKILIENENIL